MEVDFILTARRQETEPIQENERQRWSLSTLSGDWAQKRMDSDCNQARE
jgi:hypothetical protein